MSSHGDIYLRLAPLWLLHAAVFLIFVVGSVQLVIYIFYKIYKYMYVWIYLYIYILNDRDSNCWLKICLRNCGKLWRIDPSKLSAICFNPVTGIAFGNSASTRSSSSRTNSCGSISMCLPGEFTEGWANRQTIQNYFSCLGLGTK